MLENQPTKEPTIKQERSGLRATVVLLLLSVFVFLPYPPVQWPTARTSKRQCVGRVANKPKTASSLLLGGNLRNSTDCKQSQNSEGKYCTFFFFLTNCMLIQRSKVIYKSGYLEIKVWGDFN